MKITTELKNLIKGEFTNKREKVNQDNLNFKKQKYQEAISDIENNKDFKILKDTANKLFIEYNKKYSSDQNDICYNTSIFKNLKDITGATLLGNNIYRYNKSNVYQDKIDELNKQEQSLLIKLTYEKNLETIKSILKEYDINIL